MEAVILILDGARGIFIPRDFLTDGLGDIFRLHQDDDLWAVCSEKMTMEEKENFGFD